MQLADFIEANTEQIVAEWEVFARSITPGAKMAALALRDHAADIIRATVRDMRAAQTSRQRADKSYGRGDPGQASDRLDEASAVHGVDRVASGFNLLEVVAEYRALRASVMELWRKSEPNPHAMDIDDITRFNESIDQSLTQAVRSYSKRVDQSRQMFLAILAHDLRNPLNSIMMSAQVVSQSEPREELSQISSSAEVIARLISDLIDFARTGMGGTLPLSPARMDLGLLCREVLTEFQAGNPGRVLHLEASGDLTGIWDASRLRQVISNLLANAIQHGSENGAVGLSAQSHGDEVVVAVSNGGAPIPAELLPTIFDPLVRGLSPEQQRRRRPGSIGLGLYIAREVVTAHGGSIDVTSSSESGTVFTIRIPRQPLTQ